VTVVACSAGTVAIASSSTDLMMVMSAGLNAGMITLLIAT